MGMCHQKQFQAIKEAKSHIHVLDPGIMKNSSLRATLRLERVILNWGITFCNFANTHKAFVKYLNEWLLKCMLQGPEETADGNAPVSPSRIGAPPIFNLCNDWYHAIDSISEIEVSKAISNFSSSLHHLYEKQKEEQAQKAQVDYLLKDYEHRFKSFHKKNRMSWHHNSSSIDMIASGNVVDVDVPLLGGLDESLTTSRKRLIEQKARHQEVIRQVNDAASSCIQVGLSPIFEVLESYCLENLKVYEQLRLPNAVSHD